MNLRPLVIDDNAKAKVARVLAHAEQHHYRIDAGGPPPGDDERFVAQLDTYRAVFSFTHAEGGVYRHMSVSVPGGKFPNPVAVFMIAQLFGFTGYDESKPFEPGPQWGVTTCDHHQAVVVSQPIGADREKAS